MEEIIKKAEDAYKERQETQAWIDALKAEAKREQEEFEAEYLKLEKQIEKDK